MRYLIFFLLIFFSWNEVYSGIIVVCDDENPVLKAMVDSKIDIRRAESISKAFEIAKKGDGLLLLGNNQIQNGKISEKVRNTILKKQLNVYLQYPFYYGNTRPDTQLIKLERAIITTNEIPYCDSLSIMSVNDHIFYKYGDRKGPLGYIAKVAGFDKAEYGMTDVPHYPFLFKEDRTLVSGVNLSDWLISRYGPNQYWQGVWQYILNFVGIKQEIRWCYSAAVRPMFDSVRLLDRNDYLNALRRGADWYINSKLLISPQWVNLVDSFTHENGLEVVHPPVSDSMKTGNGSLGILEGHSSHINKDGSQPIRWWIRADCQAESAFALSASAVFLDHKEYGEIARNLLNYLYLTSDLSGRERKAIGNPAYGLIGWATTDSDAYYGDDNARSLLATIGASVNLQKADWYRDIIEGILGNFRTAGIYGFRGPWFRDRTMEGKTWQELGERDIVNVHPHYESWLWALYLWLYDKTGYEPLKEKAVTAISITMDHFPEWKWTNGIQQEYARMLLPLSWLVRVEDTPQHRHWLKLVALTLLLRQDSTGAIGEKLGIKGLGRYEKIVSNQEYGTKEAPLISNSSDKVADLLYTMNFASLGLNEAFAATDDPLYKDALSRINDFFVRIQIHAPDHKDLDGAWVRAFDYGRWEYWASNADSGWGPWGTQTGWTQSWILQSLVAQLANENFWDRTQKIRSASFTKVFDHTVKKMLK